MINSNGYKWRAGLSREIQNNTVHVWSLMMLAVSTFTKPVSSLFSDKIAEIIRIFGTVVSEGRDH